MKMTELKTRLQRNRPMMTVTLRMPSDVLTDLKRIAPLLGYTGYQPLMRTYIGQGLRVVLEKLEDPTMARFVGSLRHNGVSEEAFRKGMDEMAA